MKSESFTQPSSAIRDPLILDVLKQMNARRKHPDAAAFADYGFSIHPEQGDLIYLLCRAMKATREVDFATSAGMAPQLRVGGYVLNDNAEPDFLEFIRNPVNGFISVTLPIKRGTELAVKVG